ncbi:MAG: hypothetical protein QM715_20075 [Nibricoccus sp.]
MPPTATNATQRRQTRNRVWWIAAGLALAVILSGYIRCLAKYGDLTPLIRFGSEFEATAVPAIRAQPHHVHQGYGFDAQFYVQLGTDPLLLKPETPAAMDNQSVRPRRILLPLATWLFSAGGQAWLALWVYPLINLVAWLALGVVTWRILRPVPADVVGPDLGPCLAVSNGERASTKVEPYEAKRVGAFLAIVLGPGAVESASRAVTDLPAFLLAFASLSLAGFGGAIMLSLAALGRETTLLAWPGRVGDLRDWKKNGLRWILDGAICVTPLAVWMVSLHLRFGGGGAGVDGGNLGLPLSGLFTRLKEIAAHLSAQPVASVSDLILHPAIQCSVLIVSVVTQMIFLLTKPRWNDALWRWGLLAGTLGLCLGWATWEAFYTVTRHLLPLHVAFNLLLVRSETSSRSPWAWLIIGNLHVLPRVLYWLGFH